MRDFWTQFTMYFLFVASVLFIARIYYYGWKLRVAREATGLYNRFDLESKRSSVIGTVVSIISLLFVIEWAQGELWFLADILHVPRVPIKHTAHSWLLLPHIPIALATGGMFAVISLLYTGLRDRLRHRRLVYVCLGLIMLTGLLGSVLLATL